MSKRKAIVRFTQYIGPPRNSTPTYLVGKTGKVGLAEQDGPVLRLYVRFSNPNNPKWSASAVLNEGEWELVSGTIEPIPRNSNSAPFIGGRSRAQQIRMNKAERSHGKRARHTGSSLY